jgi:hypothetical protein
LTAAIRLEDFFMFRPRAFARGGLLSLLVAATLPAAPIQWTAAMGGNDNWYEYVPAISIFSPVSFAAARADALARTHEGMPGYLATITSVEEQAFIEASFAIMTGFGGGGTAYIGGLYDDTEEAFFWQDGPEAGLKVTGVKWAAGHPVAGEPNLVLYRSFSTYLGIASWGAGGAFGYIVEYGDGVVDPIVVDPPPPPDPSAVPEPSALLLSAAGLASIALRLRRRR